MCRHFFHRFLLSATTINFHYSKKGSSSQHGRVSRNVFTQLVLAQAEKSAFFARRKMNSFCVTSLKICRWFSMLLILNNRSIFASFSIGIFRSIANLYARRVISFRNVEDTLCLIQRARHKNRGNDFVAVTMLCMRERDAIYMHNVRILLAPYAIPEVNRSRLVPRIRHRGFHIQRFCMRHKTRW